MTASPQFSPRSRQAITRTLTDERPSRLVFVNRFFAPDESATSRMLSDLARRLSAKGHGVAVVTSRQLYDDPDADLPERDEIDGVEVHRVGGARLGRAKLAGRALDYLSFHWAAYRCLRRILGPGDIVIAKTDPPMLSVTVARAARARGAVLVNWLQDVFPEVAAELGMTVRPRWFAAQLLRLRNRSLRQAACNIAIGTRMAERLAAAGIDDSTIRVIPNWADVAALAPRPRSGNAVRAELGLDDSHFVVGYSGNLGRAHEYDTLLGAAALLADRPEVAFVITGAGARIEALRRDAHARGLSNVHFQPFQPPERLPDSMAAADVHWLSLLPSLEGLIVPSKFYGILAAARPAIFIGDIDGEIARDIRAFDCGFSVAVGDATALAAGLLRLRADPARLAQLGTNARRAAEESCSSEQALDAWLRMLGSLGVIGVQPRGDTPAKSTASVRDVAA